MYIHRYGCICVRAEWTITESYKHNQEEFFQKEEQKGKELVYFTQSVELLNLRT